MRRPFPVFRGTCAELPQGAGTTFQNVYDSRVNEWVCCRTGHHTCWAGRRQQHSGARERMTSCTIRAIPDSEHGIEQSLRSRQVANGCGEVVSPRHPCGASEVEAEQAKEPT